MTESVLDYMTRLGRAAREASRVTARATTAQKNHALLAAAAALDAARAELLRANAQDLAAGRANGLDDAMLDRLALTPARIDEMIEGLRQVASAARSDRRHPRHALPARPASRSARCACRWA